MPTFIWILLLLIAGRRCETGEGIYAFKCRRASLLFRALQNKIQLRNITHDSTPYPVSRMNPSPQGRQTLQASVVHRSSIDNGQPDSLRPVTNGNISVNGPAAGVERNANPTSRSPSSADILEVMPLYPRSQSSTNHASNVYQLRDFKRENNNNQGDPATELVHVYSNDFNRDLAKLRNTFKQEAGLFQIKDDEDETYFLESRYANTNIANNQPKSPLSPTLSSNSEHYAQLSLEQQESARYYINIKITDKNLQDMKRNERSPSTPSTPGGKQVEYCNLSLGPKQEVNTYANLSLGELGDSFKSKPILSHSSDHNQKFFEPDTFTSMSSIEELEVNYAVLDIDSNKKIVKMPREIASPPSQPYSSPKNDSSTSASHTSQRRSYLTSQSSVDNTTTSNDNAPTAKNGYTTIDFDKTVALTSVAADADVDSEGPRKMRHNSCNIVCGSPNSGEKQKNNN